MASPINFNQFLEKEKLKSNGSNFTDWFRHVRIFLSGGNLQFVLDAPLGDPPAEDETDEVKAVYATRKTRYSQVQCAILCSLESDLQKRFEHHDPHELMNELKAIFETHAAVECYEASKHFFSCMMEEGSSVSEHMLAMTGHAKKLSDLGIVIPNRLGINRVLQSLPPSYKNFVMNYNMQNMNKELPELFGMLKAAEIEIKKEHQVLMVNKTTSFKKQGKSKGKFKKGGKKAATPPMKPKNGPKPDAECYYCKEKGHWKRNCSKYLADLNSGLVKKKKEGMEHWTAVKNILKYLKRTKDMFLCYGGDQELVVNGYTDASWNTDPDDSKSQSGYMFILNGAAVSWASSKQCTVAKSSTESEYIAASGFIRSAVTRCSGGDAGDDDDDDGDDGGDDVQLDDGDDGVDFPLREGISPSCPPESSFLSGVLRPERRLTLRDYPLGLRFSGRRRTRRKGGERGLWAPSSQGGAARPWAAPAYEVGPPRVPSAPPSGSLHLLEK
ncbi:hypothetical protein QYE76_044026 [Lolium multiflorum]|uniref:CCHC-type domain-containing protein n=1 Tax=Lolium multiflorum TaxID=4521 RepID=A0AAD8WYQ7_LOLMU|nr:hypothetical protein QYE76_044026 [Lolium multiflorum]